MKIGKEIRILEVEPLDEPTTTRTNPQSEPASEPAPLEVAEPAEAKPV